jgi:replicative DNA helicase
MSEFENYIRVLAGASQVPVWRVKPGMFPDTYYSLQEWRPFTATLPIWINTKTSNIFEIRSQVRELVRTKAIRSLFIDYLQLLSVSPDSKMSSRAQEVATVSRVLKEIAMENQIAVFALAQFNRYAAHGEQPELHHLAESSGIEKDASLVLILDMEKQKDKDPTRECEMRIAKHRNGPCLSLKYRYRGDVLTFEEAA